MSRSVFAALLLAGIIGAGCVSRPRADAVQGTPAAPLWLPDVVARTLRTLSSAAPALDRSGGVPEAGQRAERIADYLADRLHDTGIQAGAPAYRLHFFPPPEAATPDLTVAERPLVVGLVAGRDPFASSEAVIVYAPFGAEEADRVAPAAWLELGRVYAELGRFYRFPVCSVIFLMPVGGDQGAALEAYRRQPIWPLGRVRAVLSLGASAPDAAAWHAIGLPDSVDVVRLDDVAVAGEERAPALRAVALAREGYAWLLPYVGAPDVAPER